MYLGMSSRFVISKSLEIIDTLEMSFQSKYSYLAILGKKYF
jgi:hypothetical protein